MEIKILNYCANIGEYTIDFSKQIGQGFSGKIFQCESKLNKQAKLCAKVIEINDINTDKIVNREKQISDSISTYKNNPNLVEILLNKIVRIDQNQSLIIIMEKCEFDLGKYLKTTFNDEMIEDFLKQFLNGYKCLYNQNIIHRDIKPENILINFENSKPIYKISDFGCARFYKKNDFIISQIGTPIFLAPELNPCCDDNDLKQQISYTKNKSCVDIYSLGLILHKMIKGTLPQELNQLSINKFFKQTKQQPYKIDGKSKFISLVEKMLMYYPKDRELFEELFNNYLTVQPLEIKQNIHIILPQQQKFQVKQNGNQQQIFQQQPIFQEMNRQSGNQQVFQQINRQNGQNQQFFFQQQPSIQRINNRQTEINQQQFSFQQPSFQINKISDELNQQQQQSFQIIKIQNGQNQQQLFQQTGDDQVSQKITKKVKLNDDSGLFDPKQEIINFLAEQLIIHSKTLKEKEKSYLEQIQSNNLLDQQNIDELINYFDIDFKNIYRLDSRTLQFYYSLYYLNKQDVNKQQFLLRKMNTELMKHEIICMIQLKNKEIK